MPLKAIFAQNTPYSKFLLAVGFILCSVIFFTTLSIAAAMAVYGIGMTEMNAMLADFTNPKALPVFKFIQAVSTIGTFILPAFFMAYVFDRQPVSYLSLSRKVSASSVLLVILSLLAALPLINYLGELNAQLSLPHFLSGVEKWMRDSEDKAAQLTKYFLEMHSPADVFFNVLLIGLLPAIGEELLFRGIVQKIFTQMLKNTHVAVWITAILFSAMHVQFYGFLPRMMLGVLLGYLLEWSGSLWLPIIAHFVNNASAVILTYLFREEMIGMDADKIGTESDYQAVMVSIVLTGALLWMIYRKERSLRAIPGSGPGEG